MLLTVSISNKLMSAYSHYIANRFPSYIFVQYKSHFKRPTLNWLIKYRFLFFPLICHYFSSMHGLNEYTIIYAQFEVFKFQMQFNIPLLWPQKKNISVQILTSIRSLHGLVWFDAALVRVNVRNTYELSSHFYNELIT